VNFFGIFAPFEPISSQFYGPFTPAVLNPGLAGGPSALRFQVDSGITAYRLRNAARLGILGGVCV
jgi:hypothetical protein